MGRVLFTLFLAVALGSPANAAVFGLDDRTFARTDPPSPYSPIGLVEGFGQYTTGTLVNRCDVLTAQHLARRTSDPIGERVSFFGALGSSHRLSSEGTIIATGGFVRQKVRTSQSYDNVGSDWMVVRLDECLGDKLGWARLVRQRPANGTIPTHLQDAGFPTDRPRSQGLTVDPDCAIKVVAPMVLFHDCASLHGNSGGPIFRLVNVDGVQRMEVFGITTAVFTLGRSEVPTRGEENVATPTWNVTYADADRW